MSIKQLTTGLNVNPSFPEFKATTPHVLFCPKKFILNWYKTEKRRGAIVKEFFSRQIQSTLNDQNYRLLRQETCVHVQVCSAADVAWHYYSEQSK